MRSARQLSKAGLLCRQSAVRVPGSALARPHLGQLTPLQPPHRLPPSHVVPRTFSTVIPRRQQDTRDADSSTPPLDEATKIRLAAENVELHAELVARQARATFGDTLPRDFLTPDEYAVYERLFGKPVRETTPEDIEVLLDPEDATSDASDPRVKNILLKENADGGFDEIEFDPALGFRVTAEDVDQELVVDEAEFAEPPADAIQIQARNQREAEVIMQLKRDMDEALARAALHPEPRDEFEEDEEDDDDFEDDDGAPYTSSEAVRAHPNTLLGRSGTSPSTISLPLSTFVEPSLELLERVNHKHLREAAEKAFGGPGLPFSTATPASKRTLPQKHIGLEAAQFRMSEVEADAYLAGVMPGTFAAVESALVEVRKRLGSRWLRDLLLRGGEGVRVLDAGGGGAGLIAWQQLVEAEWKVMKDEGLVKGDAPTGKSTVLTGPTTLRHRVSRFLDDTTFLPRLPDYVHSSNSEELLDGGSSQNRKSFDIILAPHRLLPLKDEFRRRLLVQNLWTMLDPAGGVILFLEKGLPRGFETVAGARDLILKDLIASPESETLTQDTASLDADAEPNPPKEPGMIVAPCTNHSKCPMYHVSGVTPGRKDFCHFSQRFVRPSYLQKLVGASARNHDDVKFSYLAVQRGVDHRQTSNIAVGEEADAAAFHGYEGDFRVGETLADNVHRLDKVPPMQVLSLPRAIMPPLKRRGHVTLDVCTPTGKLERWTIPRSFSAQAYRDARKSRWGDLWALGAKTRVERRPRLGRALARAAAEEQKPNSDLLDGDEGDVQAARRSKKVTTKAKKRHRAERDGTGKDVFEVGVDVGGITDVRKLTRGKVGKEKRTKGGRVFRPPKPIGMDDF